MNDLAMNNHPVFLAQVATEPPAQVPIAPPQPSLLDMLTPVIFMFVLLYFVMIRPQKKKQQEHEKLIGSVKTGDKVVTNAGLHGIVANVKDKTFILKAGDNVKLEFDKTAIAAVIRQSSE